MHPLMPQPRKILHLPTPSGATLGRWSLVVAATLIIAAFGRSSSAEFETPFVDTTNSLANVEFRGVWAFDRGYDDTTDSTPAINRYEAFAVGVDTSNPDTTNNGAMYFYDGGKWLRITSPISSPAKPFSLNGVVGQIDPSYGTLDKLWVIGPGGRMEALSNYTGTLGADNKFPAWPYLDDPAPVTLYPALSSIDFYAVDAVNEIGGRVMAGGENGVIVKDHNPGNFRFISIPKASTGIGVNESVTGIRFTTATEAYVTTTTFPIESGTKRFSPFQHTCSASGETTPTGTGYLYKVDLSNAGDGVWTKVKTDPNNCFYGLAVAQNDSFQSVVWVASAIGLYRYNSVTGAWEVSSGTQNKPQYSAVAISQRGGTGTNLLRNGNFNLNPIDPLGWVQLGQLGFSRYYKNAGPCTLDNGEIQVTNTNGMGDGTPYLKVTNRAIYKIGCDPLQKVLDGLTTGVYQTVPFSTTEGQRFKVSGNYRVEFPNYTDPVPSKAQGGVALTCAGSNVQDQPRTIDCSVSNRKFIRTVGHPTIDPATGLPGWEKFEMIISREDGIFNNINRYSGLYVTKRKMDIQVRCEATYGATVSCDNLKVEPIDDPPTLPRPNTVTVIAAGRDLATNGIAINEDAFNTPAFQREAVPSKVRLAAPNTQNQVNAMFAVGTQHVFAVGQGYDVNHAPVGLAIFNRTPSTLQGTIWVGAKNQTGPNTVAAVGPISVSCIDDRGANNDQQTLCQRVPESYGMSLEITSAYNVTKTGRLTGRAWFGKVADPQETLDLGKCINPPAGPQGIQNVTYTTIKNGICDYNPSNDSGSRRCKAVNDAGQVIIGTTSVSCLTNFDCLGRCEKDAGFVCLQDDDCRVGPNSYADQTWTPTPFGVQPAARLTCGATTNGLQSSPLACTPNGWLSFNANDFTSSTPPNPPGGSFGVSYNTSFVGCQNGKCSDGTACVAGSSCVVGLVSHNHNPNFDAQNQGAHELSGWGRLMTLVNPTTPTDGGWVRLRGADLGSANGATISAADTNKLFACRNCDSGTLNNMNCAFCQDASNHSCVPSDTSPVAACYNVCKDDTTKHCSTINDCTAQGPCVTPGFCTTIPPSGTAFACTQDDACLTKNGGPGGTCAVGAVCSAVGARCTQYGVNLDTTTGKFFGYAWSQDFGWLDFRNVSYASNRLLQTKLGDIYATGQIGNAGTPLPQITSNCNSTFLITSGSSITGFCSASGATINGLPTTQPNSAAIPFLSAENTYQNVLGRFDLVGIEKETPIGGGKNKYGSTIQTLTPSASNAISASWNSQGAMVTNTAGGTYLGGKVYKIGTAGLITPITYTLDAAMQFNNSGNPAQSGAGILIVNGNLTIATDMSYPVTNNPGNVSIANDLRRLASLTVVVKGDLTINNTVTDIVGAYYVTGTINTATTDTVTNQYPLTVHGLMIAKQFNFARKFAGTIESPAPSELIIYDGRLQSNPMLGMTDFASSLPNSVNVNP